MKRKERWLSVLLSLALLGAAAGCSQGQAPSDGGSSSQSPAPQAGDTGEEAPGEGGEEEPEYETVIYSYNGARWSLEKLMRNQGIVLTRDQLLTEIWGYDFDGETRTVDVHIRTLRQKLGEKGEIIQTVRGVGYRVGGAA